MADRDSGNGFRKISILLADGSVLLREGLASLCESFGRYHVLGQCSDGDQAFALIRDMNPDLAILEHGLSRLYVLEVIRKLRQSGNSTRILILSDRSDRKMVLDALRCGASGYLLKNCLVRELREALEQAMDGGVWIAPQAGLNGSLDAELGHKPDQDPLESLSSREHQVFCLLIEGLRAKEIAARLEVSPKTVDTYRSNLMRKLDIHDVAGLVKFAMNRKLTS
jgi:DNA-binding NarL/FixJ family response regulator